MPASDRSEDGALSAVPVSRPRQIALNEVWSDPVGPQDAHHVELKPRTPRPFTDAMRSPAPEELHACCEAN